MSKKAEGVHPFRTCVHAHDCDFSPCPYCERDALAASLAKYQECRVHDVDEKNWLRDRVTALEAALREIYEVYAGSDGFIPETAPEAYQKRLIKQMADIAGRYSASETKPVDSITSTKGE